MCTKIIEVSFPYLFLSDLICNNYLLDFSLGGLVQRRKGESRYSGMCSQ